MNRIEVFKQMLKSEPANTMVLFGLANEYLKDGETQNAIETLELYLSKADDEGAAYGMLSKAYEETGDIDAARSALEKGIETALHHGHPTMAGEFRERLVGLI
jgi:predicted Zn-dependent protease